MSLRRDLLAIAAGTAVLFVWYGLAQAFPWGPGCVDSYSSTSGESYAISAGGLIEAPPGTWTTPAFDERFGGRMVTLATDAQFCWILSAPRSAYDFARYFGLHAVTQLGVTVLLLLVLRLIQAATFARRMLVVAAFAVAASIATYGAMMNWMGMPAAYGVGEGFNLMAGWLLAAALVDRIAVAGARART